MKTNNKFVSSRENRYLHRTIKKETNESINYRKQIKNMKTDLEYYKEYSYNACDSYNQLLNKIYNVKQEM